MAFSIGSGLVWYGTVMVILGYTPNYIVLGPISLFFGVVGHFGNKAYLKTFGLGLRSGSNQFVMQDKLNIRLLNILTLLLTFITKLS